MISLQSQQRFYLVLLVVFLISFGVSSSYRGICHDEGIGSFRAAAERVLARQPIFDPEHGIGIPKSAARLIYILFIASGFKLIGVNLLAFHIFPYLFQLLNPCLFVIVVYRFFKNTWFGLAGGLLFIFQPFNLVFLNQQHNHPFFMCFLLLLVLLFSSAVKQPTLLVSCGILASLLILTRFEEGLMFAAILYVVFCGSAWKSGIPWKWLILSFAAALATHLVFALVFKFPLRYPLYYLPVLLQRQAVYGGQFSPASMFMRAFRNFLNWYFCGKFFAPVLGALLIAGIFRQIKTRLWQPFLLFAPFFLFLLFIYNGRYDVINLPVTTFSVPGYILLLLGGIQYIQQKLVPARRPIVGVLLVIGILGMFGRAAYSLAIVVEDAQPASTMWRIVRNNPPMPGNPAYQDAFIQLTRAERLPVELREELIKRVRGNYRSWYVNTIGKYAFKQNLPEKARTQADFVYVDEYETKGKWEQDRYALEGASPLWNDGYPGRLGAFPKGKSGAFIYKFDLPRPIEDVIISDIHTQWGMGDVTKMWTSTDGEHWVLRHDNWNVRYTKDYYYQFFADDFDGHKTIFIKYFFYAGDSTRTGNDNRGACLDEFSLAVKYEE